jgi:hypothetical protein
MRVMAEGLADPEKALAAVEWLKGHQSAIPKMRDYMYAQGDLASRHAPRALEENEESTANPSPAFNDLNPSFGVFAQPVPTPRPDHQPQIDAAETKRAQAADKMVNRARTSAMDPPKITGVDVRKRGVKIDDIAKRSEEARRKPFEQMLERNKGDLRTALAALEALKPNELDMVRDKAQAVLGDLMDRERDDFVVADAMARMDALFAPPPEEGAAGAASQ